MESRPGDCSGRKAAFYLQSQRRPNNKASSGIGTRSPYASSLLAVNKIKLPPSVTALSASESPRIGPESPLTRFFEKMTADFLRRREELLLLNPGRRRQAELLLAELEHLEKPLPLERLLGGKNPSENSGIYLFAQQLAIFHAAQLFLLKRWSDRGELEHTSLPEDSQKANYLVASHLRASAHQHLFGRHQWGFLRINLYSWFRPSSETWALLLDAAKDVNLANASNEEFLKLIRLGSSAANRERLGLHACGIGAKLLWESFARILSLNNGTPDTLPEVGKGAASRTFISGLGSGTSVLAAGELAHNFSPEGIFGFARSEIDLFLGEIAYLWGQRPGKKLPFSVSSASRLHSKNKPDPRQSALAPAEISIPNECAHALVFSDPCGDTSFASLSEASILLQRLREHGLLLLASDAHWLIDKSELCEELRTRCLDLAALQLVIDLRHLQAPAGINLPKTLCIFERASSKEIRDSNRPKILKCRGNASVEGLEEMWQLVLDSFALKDSPGEVKIFQIGSSLHSRIRVELMSAATNQGQLSSQPWVSLAEPSFYQISAKLKQFPHKSHQLGFLLKPQRPAGTTLKKGVHFWEIPGRALFALPGGVDPESDRAGARILADHPKVQPHLFVPEMGVLEQNAFFAAMINSSPIQFWYRLEFENYTSSGARRNAKPTDTILKLMPFARIFRPSPQAAEPLRAAIAVDLSQCEQELLALVSSPESIERSAVRIQKVATDLEATIDYHLAITREYAKHLYSDLALERWHVSSTLPEISPDLALRTLQHLAHAPLRQHPSLQVNYLRQNSDFKVTDTKLHLGQNGISELHVFCGPEANVRIVGPSLFVRAAAGQMERRLQRPWSEISAKISLPLDAAMVMKQLNEFVRLTKDELEKSLYAVRLSDFLFSRLLGLEASSPISGDALLIRNHLNPVGAALPLSAPMISSSTVPSRVALLRKEIGLRA